MTSSSQRAAPTQAVGEETTVPSDGPENRVIVIQARGVAHAAVTTTHRA